MIDGSINIVSFRESDSCYVPNRHYEVLQDDDGNSWGLSIGNSFSRHRVDNPALFDEIAFSNNVPRFSKFNSDGNSNLIPTSMVPSLDEMFTLIGEFLQLGELLKLDGMPNFDKLLDVFRGINSLDIVCPNGFGRSKVKLDTGEIRTRNIVYPFEGLENFFGIFIGVPKARAMDNMNLFRIVPSSRFRREISKGLGVELHGHAILYSKHDRIPIVRSLYTFNDSRLSDPLLQKMLHDNYGHRFVPNIGHTPSLPMGKPNSAILPYPDTSYSTILAMVRSLNELLKRI